MDRKYQVFVSSTYKDLIEERSEVMKSLLELDCIPTGMELFPSADDDQLTYIKKVIDNCDYYVLILGGRYGTLHHSGKSYTHLEYEYALEKDIPIIAFLHSNPNSLPAWKVEQSSKGKKKYDQFRDQVQKKLCRFWTNQNELGALVSRSVVKLIKDHKRNGWIRAKDRDTPTTLSMEDFVDELRSIKEYIKSPTLRVYQNRYVRDEMTHGAKKLELEIVALTNNETSDSGFTTYGIVLEESKSRKKIEVVVGGYEAQSIAIPLENIKTSRPLTHDLVVSIIRTTNIELKEVIIDFYHDGIFYSKLMLEIGATILEVDSRTSDALALAVRLNVPIYSYASAFDAAYKKHKHKPKARKANKLSVRSEFVQRPKDLDTK